MMIVLVFLLGIGNFAVHKAVLERGHPAFEQMPARWRRRGGRVTFAFEFLLLLGALLLAATAHSWSGPAYLVYSALNGLSGWLILSRRV